MKTGMKNKRLLIVLFILVIFTLILSAKEVRFDFRKINWGMTIEQVKASEDKKPDFEGDVAMGWALGYEIEIGLEDYYCFYYFLEDKLYLSAYAFAGNHTNKNDYIQDYEGTKELLIKKYGELNKKKLLSSHNREEVYWEYELYKDDENDWGLAISVGELSYVSIWETPTTEIELILDGDNYEISLRIMYESKELKEWANKILEEKAKSIL